MMIKVALRAISIVTLAVVWAYLAMVTAEAETLDVRLDKAEIHRLAKPAAVVFVGNPDIADVTIEEPTLMFVIGRSAGETNMINFDDTGEQIGDYDIVVVAERDRHVTVNRATELLSTFSCDRRCIEVANPSDIERQRQFAESDDDDDDGLSGPDPDADAADEAGEPPDG